MTDHRDFDADAAPADPSCTFALGGRDWTCRPRGDVPWHLVNRVFSLSPDGDGVLIQVDEFFRGVLVPDDVEPFMELLNRPDSPITEAKIQPLMEWIAERVFDRPTKPSANSGRSSRRRQSSAGGSSSPDTPRLASA